MNGTQETGKTFGLWILTALVLGNMVGSGIFMLPRTLAETAGPFGVIAAWLVTGAGVLALALTFGSLALRKPELNGGPQLYAQALFGMKGEGGRFAGYLASWGYWVANWAGNVSLIITFTSYLSVFFPMMNNGETLFSVGAFTVKTGNAITFCISSLLLWLMYALISQGVEGAGRLNFWATAAKVGGFVLLLIAGLALFDANHMLPLLQERTVDGKSLSLGSQINHGAINTLWAFIGVESAVVFSSRARRKEDVKKATMLGLFIALVIYLGITLLVMGALPQDKLMASASPLAEVLGVFVGTAGEYVMAGLGLLAMIGSMLGWILLSAEVPYQSGKMGLFPPVMKRVNGNGVPITGLVLTCVMMQVLLVSLLSKTIGEGFDFIILIATLAFLIPYLFSSLFLVKMVLSGDGYSGRSDRLTDGIVGMLAFLYSLWMVKAGTADMKTFLLGMAFIFSGVLFYPFVRKSLKRN
ncbi:amino acid permease [Gorillibacterium massiliense]|uniref:amino acid permease n=1 Tax=Gorillibacterium massiliense TaxID=1280390 RepID=UPI00059531ED|nr:amino acid permease [Gorillibacterium massiliense]